MSAELTGKTIGEWSIGKFINFGKSAVVLRARGRGKSAAIKIFDPEIVETYGDQKQLERIERERTLIGKIHPNLIEIFDGGETTIDDQKLYFIVMEFFSGENLATKLDAIPLESIWSIISQVAAAAQFLESMELCHRDIKPENIGISEDLRHVKLLDLGVLRPFSATKLTDEGARPFIGTLRYAPPEFLLRNERQDREGWRAVSLYQLGGVLHDLIMRTPLFYEFSEPFARLVNAVQQEKPKIASSQVSPDLVELAKRCLSKKPELRLELVTWEDFQPPRVTVDPVKAVKEKISKRNIETAAADRERKGDGPEQDREESAWKLKDYCTQVQSLIRDECIESGLFPRLTGGDVTDHFNIVFEPFNGTNGKNVRLTFLVSLDWLDAADDLVSITICAVASLSQMKEEDERKLVSDSSRPIYKGHFNQEMIAAAISPFLYLTLDAAQRLSSTEIAEATDASIVFDVTILDRLSDEGELGTKPDE